MMANKYGLHVFRPEGVGPRARGVPIITTRGAIWAMLRRRMKGMNYAEKKKSPTSE